MPKILTADETERVAFRIGGADHAKKSFGNLTTSPKTRYDWHSHRHHQLVYSLSAAAQIEIGGIRHYLQPGCAAWITAGVVHRTTTGNALASVFFSRQLVKWKTPFIAVFPASPLLREMMIEAARWKPDEEDEQTLRTSFFRTLALLCKDWMLRETPFWLPDSTDPQISRALIYAQESLQTATIEAASDIAGMSERNFRRHFSASMCMNWRTYLLRARLLRAMELLAFPDSQVTAVAGYVGFDSPSAFSKAFQNFTGETPKRYQIRIVNSLSNAIHSNYDDGNRGKYATVGNLSSCPRSRRELRPEISWDKSAGRIRQRFSLHDFRQREERQ